MVSLVWYAIHHTSIFGSIVVSIPACHHSSRATGVQFPAKECFIFTFYPFGDPIHMVLTKPCHSLTNLVNTTFFCNRYNAVLLGLFPVSYIRDLVKV